MRCEDIMRRDIECLSPQDSVQLAAQKMRDKNIGFLPICDNRRVLGTITDRDIAVRLVAERRQPSLPVGEIMTREAITCRPSDDLAKAAELLAKHQKSRLMCLDDSGHLVGVISLADLARSQDEKAVGVTLRAIKRL